MAVVVGPCVSCPLCFVLVFLACVSAWDARRAYGGGGLTARAAAGLQRTSPRAGVRVGGDGEDGRGCHYIICDIARIRILKFSFKIRNASHSNSPNTATSQARLYLPSHNTHNPGSNPGLSTPPGLQITPSPPRPLRRPFRGVPCKWTKKLPPPAHLISSSFSSIHHLRPHTLTLALTRTASSHFSPRCLHVLSTLKRLSHSCFHKKGQSKL